MKLYEVNAALEELVENAIDEETGELTTDSIDFVERFNALKIERRRILEYLAKLVLNTRSDIGAVKEEEKRLKARRQRLERKERGLMEILSRECNGEKTDLGVATVNYRKTAHLEVDNLDEAASWLIENKYDNCYTLPEPIINKTEVKALVRKGIVVPGVSIEGGLSCSLK